MYVLRFNGLLYLTVARRASELFNNKEVIDLAATTVTAMLKSKQPLGALDALQRTGNAESLDALITSAFLLGEIEPPVVGNSPFSPNALCRYKVVDAITALFVDIKNLIQQHRIYDKVVAVTIHPTGYGEISFEPSTVYQPSTGYF